MNKALKPRIFLENTPTVERIVPELATVIGLNESIMLLQIDFWIGVSDHYIDGRWWTYQSTREMQDKAFPFWGIGTIHRTAISLEKQGLVVFGNYNKRPHDKTRWFALNGDGLKVLSRKCPTVQFFVPEPDPTVIQPVVDYATPLEQDRNTTGTGRSKLEQPVPERNDPFQNGTTLPETTTEIIKDSAPMFGARKPRAAKPDAIPALAMNPMKDRIAELFNLSWDSMTDGEKGVVQKAARQLCKAQRTPEDATRIYAYCKRKFEIFSPMALTTNASAALRNGSGSDSHAPLIHHAPDELRAQYPET